MDIQDFQSTKNNAALKCLSRQSNNGDTMTKDKKMKLYLEFEVKAHSPLRDWLKYFKKGMRANLYIGDVSTKPIPFKVG